MKKGELNFMTQQEMTYQYLGKGRKLVEGLEKVTGRVRYAGDLTLPGMLYARPILSPYAHAKILSIDTTEAEKAPGVVAVLTAQDLPTKDRVIASRNSAILAKEKVLFRGQPVVVVVGETEAAAQDGADLVLIDYEPLPAVIDPLKAMAAGAPIVWPGGLPKEDSDLAAAHTAVDKKEEKEKEITNVHSENHFERGDVEQGFKDAEVVIERTYKIASFHQGYMEPHATVAEPDPFRGSLTIYTSTQGQFLVRDEVSRILGLPKSKVTIVPMTLGGGFGAKYGILDPLIGAVALAVKQPVRIVLTRSEDFLTTTPSQAAVITLKTGAKKDGKLTAIQAKVVLDNGIFAFAMGGIVGALLGGYYKCENVKIECYEVITNKPQTGAYRAPGAPQATFALESNIEDMAQELGIDPLEFRLKNAAEAGDPMGNNDPWPSLGLKECLQQMQEHPAWKNQSKGPNEGIGLAIGGWPSFMGPAAAVCRVDSDGTIRVHVGSVDISGINSSFVLVAAEALGVSPDQIEIIQGDTRSGPYAPNSGGSQVTYSVAGAIDKAAKEVRRKLLELASDHFEASIDDLELKEGKVQVKGVPDRTISISELASIAQSKVGGPGPIMGEGQSAVEVNAPGFVVHLAKVAVDPETGDVVLKQYVAIQDVGFALNPTMVEGQIHGGSVQGIGMGLHEAIIYDEDGQLLTASFMDYDLPKMNTVPNIDTILVHNPAPNGPFGLRGVGEPPIVAGAAALANAIKDATGVRVTELPIRKEVLWQALQDNGQ
jgi:CO/xanthine dehydrogenase Mo-binding subunit